MIWKLVRRNIAATKGRLVLMLLSIVLGVSFVCGSFLLADSLRAVFGDIATQVVAGIDAQVQAADSDLASGFERTRFSDEVVDRVVGLAEVEHAEGIVGAFEQVFTLDAEGEINRPVGPPVFAWSWGGPSPLSSYNLLEGRGPSGDEIVIDESQANAHDIEVGQTIMVSAPAIEDPIPMQVVGTVRFGELEAAGSAYFNLFDLPTMQRLLGAEGVVDAIAVNGDDNVSSSELVAALSAAVDDPRLEVVGQETLLADQNAEFGEFIDIFGNILLGFAIVVLFVSVFIIYNTFAILIGQRVRQFGLLRSIGVTGRQIRTMVLVEALAIGVLASLLGLLGGIGIASFLEWLFSTAGDGGFPDGPLVFKPRTIITVFVLGIGVTVASALLPAWLAQRIPALAALRDGAAARPSSRRRRVLVGAVTLGLGVLLVMWGLFGSLDIAPRLSALGFGAALLFIGVAALSVLFAARVTRALGAPVETVKGLAGRLGRDNASRNPQRTAATATALMIGLALITGVLVLTDSIRSTFDRILDETVAADLFVYEENQGLPFAGTSVAQLLAVPEVADVAAVADLKVEIDGQVTGVSGFDVASEDRVLDIGLYEGTYAAGDNGVLLARDEAEATGHGLGSTVSVTFEDGYHDTFEVVGLFEDATLMGNPWVFDRAVTAAHSNVDVVGFAGVTFAPDANPETARAAAEASIANFPQLLVEDNTEFKQTQEGQLNQLLAVIFGLLFLCIVVAFIGIVNTMALSILERTREIGLLRAVGTTRRQLRSMVRWEAVIVGVFGAVLGVVLGMIIGIAAVTAIPDSFISEVSIPWVWAIVFTIIGGLLGMLAAIFPARRAAQMNVLDAISTL